MEMFGLETRLSTAWIDDDVSTETSQTQFDVETSVKRVYRRFIRERKHRHVGAEFQGLLRRDIHSQFLLNGLDGLSSNFECLDASRPWLCYWIIHSLSLLEVDLTSDLKQRTIDFLGRCQCLSGGFGGGPDQLPHLAPTYAAVNVLCSIGTEEAFNIIDRQSLHDWMMTLRDSNGAFRMHEDGEIDVRGAYCALSVGTMLNLLTPELIANTAQWVASCQTFEGGIAGVPGLEAHGGYSFCGFAALAMLSATQMLDCQALLQWTVSRQMSLEGGFQGRTNKLVDGCYSFWQGGAFPLLHQYVDGAESVDGWLFDTSSLQEYVLLCCQDTARGGLLDKPGKPRDFYHTCYCLSGLSSSQHFFVQCQSKEDISGSTDSRPVFEFRGSPCVSPLCGPSDILARTHPLHNIVLDKALAAIRYFACFTLPSVNITDTVEQ